MLRFGKPVPGISYIFLSYIYKKFKVPYEKKYSESEYISPVDTLSEAHPVPGTLMFLSLSYITKDGAKSLILRGSGHPQTNRHNQYFFKP